MNVGPVVHFIRKILDESAADAVQDHDAGGGARLVDRPDNADDLGLAGLLQASRIDLSSLDRPASSAIVVGRGLAGVFAAGR